MTGRATPIRLLLVEDDPDSAEELAELLESHGMTIRVAATAAEARTLQSNFAPEIALVDLQLGESSGAQLAAEWQARGNTVVVLLSGRELTLAERALFGADGPPPLLAKPLNIHALKELVLAGRP